MKPNVSALSRQYAISRQTLATWQREGIDIANNVPKVLSDETVKDSDYVITMGCGDACPFFPGKTYLDWPLNDPAGKGVDEVRPIRDEIRAKVEALIAEIDAKF